MSRSLSLVFAAAVALLAACGSKSTDEIGSLAREACACKDKACGTAVNKKLDAALEKLNDEKAIEQAAPSLAQAGDCLSKLGVAAE